MARGTQHRKRRPAADARATDSVAPRRKAKQASWEDELFFNRLRRHAKWMYILLVAVFAGGFVFLGVGSGSSGIGDILQGFFDRSASSGASAGELREKVQDEPRNAEAWHDLATRLQQDGETEEAVDALKRFTALRPRNAEGLQELAALYGRRADEYRAEAQAAQVEAQTLAPGALFQPAATTDFGRLYQDPSALQDPVANAITTEANTKASDAYSQLAEVSREAVVVYKRLIALEPTDATHQIQLAEAAQNAGDTATAVAAYKRFLKLAPDDPLADAVKQQLQALQGASSAAASG